jgi:hypothetical protein
MPSVPHALGQPLRFSISQKLRQILLCGLLTSLKDEVTEEALLDPSTPLHARCAIPLMVPTPALVLDRDAPVPIGEQTEP